MTIFTTIDSPVGPLTLAGTADGVLQRLSFGAVAEPGCDSASGAAPLPGLIRDDSPSGAAPSPGLIRDDGAFPDVRAQLNAYFAGALQRFEIRMELIGTRWERRVWETLRTIPYGETRSYGEVASVACTSTGHRAARAVGAANGRNPIAIIVPCHRVIGADGRLVGFGGGLETKRALLDLEAGRLALV